ncbi:hypothetical protein MTR67_000497 [Solanum verrucosum]|uniref:Leucine-rich repeat-containing N-terminal plant-type domain-containing protein n=1 Tax=Solanum verrucosum TaxID=315347 RepID=A0AAF0PMK4_SOLVR|nr:hypothetical protein MTR67_000497 [Solanum verrucosum]
MGYVKLVFFMIFPFLCQLSLSFCSSLSHLCPKDQALALLQFKHMFTISHDPSDYCFDITDHLIQSYPKTLSWNKSTDCCSWDGVSCDETTGKVIELNLTCSKLQGKFHSNSSVFQLSNLKRLDLSNNNFFGSFISPKFGQVVVYSLEQRGLHTSGRIHSNSGQLEFLSFNRIWTQLEWLDCSVNSVTGPIPSNVSGMQNLQSLRLSSNHLNGTTPSWIFSLPSLTGLELSDNHFSGNIQEFKSKTLSRVSLKQNQLQGPIPKSLLNQRDLHYLLFSHNNLSGQIASTICNLKTLGVLDLGSNNLEGTIPLCLGEMSELWVLDLSSNNLSGTINTTFSIGTNL